MSTNTKIEWTEQTWNPTVGCTKISPGCKNCYAEKMALRLQAMGMPGYENGFSLTVLPKRLEEPPKRKKPTIYFVNSMSDLFHINVPDSFIMKVLEAMRTTPQHRYQILTKRAKRAGRFLRGNLLPDNAWMGVTVENRKHGLPRLDLLRDIPAKVRFLSIEPLLEDLGEIDLAGIHWVIVGGESGHRARSINPEWVKNLRDQCLEQEVPFFFKQWGTWGPDGIKRGKKQNGRVLEGRIWDQMPVLEKHPQATLVL
jgi:protein gp37